MKSTTEILSASYTIIRADAEKLLSGINRLNASRKPPYSDSTLDMNHPAFIYGHLAIYPTITLGLWGDTFTEALSRIDLPPQYHGLFSKGSICRHDPDNLVYPDFEEIVNNFRRGYDILTTEMHRLSHEQLIEPMPSDRVARFPTKGSFLAHIVSGHLGIHMGQMSAWRRAMHLSPV